MLNDKLGGNKSPISFDLEEEINNALEEKGNVLLFLNKKKEAGHLFCKSCKNNQYLEKQPSVCPNCESPDIFWNVLNISSLALEVKRLFPNYQTHILSQTKTGVKPLLGVEPQSLVTETIDIGTAYSLYAPLSKKYDLVAHIQTDSLLNLADYSSAEKLFAQVTSLKKLLKENGILILQTYNAEHPIINSLEKGDYLSFFKEELSQRKLLSYPPYSLLTKLTLKGKSEVKIKTEADALASQLSINHSPFTILGAYKSVFWQKQPTYHIILKVKIDSYSLEVREKCIKELSSHLEKGNKKYTIEIEPDSIQ